MDIPSVYSGFVDLWIWKFSIKDVHKISILRDNIKFLIEKGMENNCFRRSVYFLKPNLVCINVWLIFKRHQLSSKCQKAWSVHWAEQSCQYVPWQGFILKTCTSSVLSLTKELYVLGLTREKLKFLKCTIESSR